MPAASEYKWTDHALDQLDERFPGHDKDQLIAGSVRLQSNLVQEWKLDTSEGKEYRIHDSSGCILSVGEGRYGDPVIVTLLQRSKILDRLRLPVTTNAIHPNVRGRTLGKAPEVAEYWKPPVTEEIPVTDPVDLDAELSALQAIVQAMKTLDGEQIERVMRYLLGRYVDGKIKAG